MDLSKRNQSEGRIDWFDDFVGPNKYRFLSNFYVGEPIEHLDTKFQTGEHLFAAMKANSRNDFQRIVRARNPSMAKAIGREIDLRHDWELIKYDVMRVVLSLKFTKERIEGLWLVKTGSDMLVEGNDWNDKVWGVNRSNGLGRNWLGTLLMARRAELLASAKSEPFDYSATHKFVQPGWIKTELNKR